MANNIKLKRSSVPGKVPLLTDLDYGELAINTYDGIVYIKQNSGTESIKAIGSGDITSLDNSVPSFDGITGKLQDPGTMFISDSGDVGVGGVSSGAKLSVLGDIEVNSQTNLDSGVATTSSTDTTTLSSFSGAEYRTGKFIIQATNTITGEIQSTELFVVHDGTTAFLTEYGTIFTGAGMFLGFGAEYLLGNINITVSPLTANTINYKIFKTLIKV